MPNVIGIAGNASRPSKTQTLVSSIVNSVSAHLGAQGACFDIVDAQPELGATLYPESSSGTLASILSAIDNADVLVVGSPTYKASYTGLLKHLFDLVDMKALRGRPVIVCATGKAPGHGPKIEQHFRMLFEFFDAKVSPGFVFALDDDFDQAGEPTHALVLRIADEVAQAEEAGIFANAPVEVKK